MRKRLERTKEIQQNVFRDVFLSWYIRQEQNIDLGPIWQGVSFPAYENQGSSGLKSNFALNKLDILKNIGNMQNCSSNLKFKN